MTQGIVKMMLKFDCKPQRKPFHLKGYVFLFASSVSTLYSVVMATCAVGKAEMCGKALCESGGYGGSNVEAEHAEKASPELRRNSKSSVTAGIRRSDSSYALLLRLEEAGAEWRDVEGFSDTESPKQSILNDENEEMGRSLSPSKRWETDRDRFMQISHLHQAPTFPRVLCVSRRYLRKNKYVDITGE